MNTLVSFGELFSKSFVERIGWVLIHSLWQLAIIALLAGIAARVMRRSSSAMRYGVLVVAMFVAVAAPAATWILALGEVPRSMPNPEVFAVEPFSSPPIAPKSEAARLPADAMLASDSAVIVPASEFTASRDVSETRPTASGSSSASQSKVMWLERAKSVVRPWLAWIVVGWGSGVVVCSARPLLGWYTLRRLQRVGVSPASKEARIALRRVTEQLGLYRTVQLLHSTLAQVPIVVGYFRPVILLPVSLMTTIPTAQLDAILAHELAHVRRHDFAVNLLQTLIETLFFYHPAVWWLSHQIRIEREHCCDDLVVKLLDNRLEYGRALIAVEQLRGHNSVLALGATDGSLLSRVRRIVDLNSPPRTSSLVDRLPAVVLILVSIGISSVLSVTWNLVAKDDPQSDRAVVKDDPPPALETRLQSFLDRRGHQRRPATQ